jgi:hypothetical protein
MNNFKYCAIALTLVASAPMARAAVEGSEALLWEKFDQQITSVGRGGNKDPNFVVVLNAPGIPLRPLSSKSQEDRLYVNELMDQTMKFNAVFQKGDVSFSQVYNDILTLHKTNPPIPLSASEQSDLDAAKELVKQGSPSLKAYKKYRNEYNDAIEARELKRWENVADGKGLKNPKSMDSDVDDAINAWNNEGNRATVGAAFATIVKYSNNNPETWWNNLAEEYRTTLDGKFHNVSTFPPMDLWASDDGWVKFTYKNSAQKSSQTANSMDVQASMSVNVGKLSASASGGYKTDAMKAMASDTSMVITMEVKKVLVNRPDVNRQAFTDDRWWWDKGAVSDAKGNGMMPIYIEAFLIVRKVKIKSKKLESMKAELMKEINASASVSYGPFSCSASFRKKDESKESSQEEEEGAISIPDPQIIAYCGSVVPKCPAKTVK